MEFRRGTFFSDLIWIYLLEKKKKKREKKRWWCTFPGPFHHVHPQGDWHPPAALNKKVSLSTMPPIFPTLRSKRDVCNHKYEHHALHNKKKKRCNGVTPIEMEGALFSKEEALLFILLLQASPSIQIGLHFSPKKKLGGHLPTFIWCVNDFLYRTKFCKSYTSCNLLLNQVKGNLGDVENVRIYYF